MPNGRGAPSNPAACRYPSSVCTAGVWGPAGRRTVSPTRTPRCSRSHRAKAPQHRERGTARPAGQAHPGPGPPGIPEHPRDPALPGRCAKTRQTRPGTAAGLKEPPPRTPPRRRKDHQTRTHPQSQARTRRLNDKLSVLRSEAGPVAPPVRMAWHSFFAAPRRRPGELVLFTGPDDDRSGQSRQAAGRHDDLPGGEPAGVEAGEQWHHVGDVARCAQAAQRGRPDRRSGAANGVAWDLRLYLVCPQPDLMGTDPGRPLFSRHGGTTTCPTSTSTTKTGCRRGSGWPAHACIRPGRHLYPHRIWVSRSREVPRCRSGRSQS
jgi:hypothetical protein